MYRKLFVFESLNDFFLIIMFYLIILEKNDVIFEIFNMEGYK